MLEVREHTICQAKLFANDEVYKNVSVNKACIAYARSAGLDVYKRQGMWWHYDLAKGRWF